MQPAQQIVLTRAQPGLPHQQSLATVGAQDLFGGPAGIDRVIGLQMQQPGRLHTQMHPAGGIDLVRCLQQGDAFGPGDPGGSLGAGWRSRQQWA